MSEWPTGWHRDRDGSVVWAEGRQYTETGSAPNRVEVVKAYRHCGAFHTWSWVADLKPIEPLDAANFVQCAKDHNEGCAQRLEKEAVAYRANSRKWEDRVTLCVDESNDG